MVSNAREDFPEPDTPVMTINRSRGMSRSMDLRLCSRAPRIRILFVVTRHDSFVSCPQRAGIVDYTPTTAARKGDAWGVMRVGDVSGRGEVGNIGTRGADENRGASEPR